MFLFFLQFEHLLFDGSTDDELLNEYGLGLSDTVSSISCLSFYSRIPPGIEMDDIIRRDQIESSASRLERYEKYPSLSSLEALDE